MQNQELSWLLFRVMMTAVLGAGAYYIGKRLSAFSDLPSYRWSVWLALAGFLAIQFAAPMLYRQNDPSVLSTRTQYLLWTAYGALGFFAILAISLLLFDIVWLGLHGYARVREALGFVDTPADQNRRGFLAAMIPMAAVGGSALASSVGVTQARLTPKVRETQVPVAGLHPDLDGLTIAQISDLHVGQTINKAFVEQVVEATLGTKPDLIALTGDFVDGFVPVLKEWTSPLSRLQAPLGVVYSPGNHECYWGLEEWLGEFRNLGANVLHNQHTVISRGGARLLVTGLADHQAPRMGMPGPDILKALEGAPAHDFHLLLTHQPKGYQEADRARDLHPVHLQLSGHTHAGQFYPVAFFHPLIHRYWRGLNRHDERTWVYVHSGTGYWGPPNRFGVPSEIALLRLKKV